MPDLKRSFSFFFWNWYRTPRPSAGQQVPPQQAGRPRLVFGSTTLPPKTAVWYPAVILTDCHSTEASSDTNRLMDVASKAKLNCYTFINLLFGVFYFYRKKHELSCLSDDVVFQVTWSELELGQYVLPTLTLTASDVLNFMSMPTRHLPCVLLVSVCLSTERL